MVCNGRIYNHVELARRLDPWTDHPPTILEIMLRAYLVWGEQCFRQFNGAFACAIWDRSAQTLLLVRDPCGIKQLFVSVTAEIGRAHV